jgi:hypothetical protein
LFFCDFVANIFVAIFCAAKLQQNATTMQKESVFRIYFMGVAG